MFSKNYLFVLLVLIAFSCRKEDTGPIKEYGTGKVNFSDMKIGQKSSYTSYTEMCNEDFSAINLFFDDTILFEVLDMNDNVYTLSERYSEGSSSYENGITQSFVYEVTHEDDYLLIPIRDASVLFYFYANDTLHLNPKNLMDFEYEDCFLKVDETTFVENEIGIIRDFEVMGSQLDDKIAVSCLPSINIGIETGYILYDENGVSLSYSVRESNSPEIEFLKFGWVELDELE